MNSGIYTVIPTFFNKDNSVLSPIKVASGALIGFFGGIFLKIFVTLYIIIVVVNKIVNFL